VALDQPVGRFAHEDGPGLTIPKAGRPAHVRENAAALDFTLAPEDLEAINAAFQTARNDGPVAVQ